MSETTTPERTAFILSTVIEEAKSLNPNLEIKIVTFPNDAPALAVTDGDTWEEVEL